MNIQKRGKRMDLSEARKETFMKNMNTLTYKITMILIPVVTLGGAAAFMLGVGQLVSDMPHTIELMIAAVAMGAGVLIKSSD